jgi:hypothetical protein
MGQRQQRGGLYRTIICLIVYAVLRVARDESLVDKVAGK